MKHWVVAGLAVLLAGCGAKDFLKSIESGAYDSAATAVSEYCEKLDGPIAVQERLEARRELRQRGTDGPDAPASPVAGLDHQTAYGRGPLVRIWCEGEAVPDEVWSDFVR